MNYNHNPIYPATLKHPTVLVDTLNTALDGTGTLATLYTAPAGGAILISLTLQAIVTTAAGMIGIFIDNGSTVRLYRAVAVSATTVTGGTAPWREVVTPDSGEGLYLPEGYIVKLSNYTGEDVHAHAEVGELAR